MTTKPFPLAGGSYRVVDGVLVNEDDLQATTTDSQAIAPELATDSTTGDAAAAAAEPAPLRRRKHNED